MKMTDFFVRDKHTGRVHRVGDDQHDGIWVSSDGELHYMNLQNMDGCSGKSHEDDDYGYEFVPSDCGVLEKEMETIECEGCGHRMLKEWVWCPWCRWETARRGESK